MIILPAKVNMWGTEVKGTNFKSLWVLFRSSTCMQHGISMQQNVTCNCKTQCICITLSGKQRAHRLLQLNVAGNKDTAMQTVGRAAILLGIMEVYCDCRHTRKGLCTCLPSSHCPWEFWFAKGDVQRNHPLHRQKRFAFSKQFQNLNSRHAQENLWGQGFRGEKSLICF